MADVFISYAHEDQAFVRRMVPALEAEGFSVWWDHTIPPGQSWDSCIARGIKEARAAIVVWSTNSVDSEWVKEEAQLARNNGKYLPIQIDGSDPPIGFSRIQAAQLTNWSGDSKNPQWQMLVSEVHRVMTEADALPSQPPRRRPRHSLSSSHSANRNASFFFTALIGVGLLGFVGAGWFAYQAGWLTTRSGSIGATANDAEELAELRRQMAETQAAVEEQRHLQTGAEQSNDPVARERTARVLQDSLTSASWSGTRLMEGPGINPCPCPISSVTFSADGSVQSESSTGSWTRDGPSIDFNLDTQRFRGTVEGNAISGRWSYEGGGGTFVTGTFTLRRQ